MRAHKLFLGITAACAAGVGFAACSGGDGGGGGTHDFDSGEYNFTIEDVPTNSCWPSSNPLPIPLEGLELPVDIVSTSDTAFTLLPPETAQAFIPPITGTQNGNDLAASGSADPIFLSNSCGLAVTANAVGELTADNTFDATITATLTAVGSGGNPVDCTDWIGEDIDPGLGIPFPTLSGGGTGTCDLALDGYGVINVN